jgi:hypothetical protein
MRDGDVEEDRVAPERLARLLAVDELALGIKNVPQAGVVL